MANNRMFLVCKECKKHIAIAKYYPSTGYYTNKENFTDKFNMFLDKHWPCSQQNEGNFEIRYELAEPEIMGNERDNEVEDLAFKWEDETNDNNK